MIKQEKLPDLVNPTARHRPVRIALGIWLYKPQRCELERLGIRRSDRCACLRPRSGCSPNGRSGLLSSSDCGSQRRRGLHTFPRTIRLQRST